MHHGQGKLGLDLEDFQLQHTWGARAGWALAALGAAWAAQSLSSRPAATAALARLFSCCCAPGQSSSVSLMRALTR